MKSAVPVPFKQPVLTKLLAIGVNVMPTFEGVTNTLFWQPTSPDVKLPEPSVVVVLVVIVP